MGHNTFGLIVQEAFSSTLVSGSRMRVDLNRIGVWFADPKAAKSLAILLGGPSIAEFRDAAVSAGQAPYSSGAISKRGAGRADDSAR